MQTVNCRVALSGDMLNTVPKYDITVAEVALLRAIHGDDAVHDISPIGERTVSPRAEVMRLAETYRARNEDGRFIVAEVFPGGSPANVPMTLDDLGLPDELFKATARARSAPTPPKARRRRAGSLAPSDNADSIFDDTPGEDVAEDLMA